MKLLSIKNALLGLAASTLLIGIASAQSAAAEKRMNTQDITSKVVYHINDADTQALGALRNLRNHLDVSPKTTIIVVSHATGVDFLMGERVFARVDALHARRETSGLTAEQRRVPLPEPLLKLGATAGKSASRSPRSA